MRDGYNLISSHKRGQSALIVDAVTAILHDEQLIEPIWVEGMDEPDFKPRVFLPVAERVIDEPGGEERYSQFEKRLDEVCSAVRVMRSAASAAADPPWPEDIDRDWFMRVMLKGTPNLREAQRFVAALGQVPWMRPAAEALLAMRMAQKSEADDVCRHITATD